MRKLLLMTALLVAVNVPTALGRIVVVQTTRGPVYTNIPEPAADVPARLSSRSEAFHHLILAASEKHGLSADLIEAVIACESDFDPRAVSRVGAQGLMQLMPATAAELGVADSFDPAQNIDGGSKHLASLLRSFEGDRRLAIAAYNAGEGAVRRAGGIPPFPETKRYVEKVQRYAGLRRVAGRSGPAATPAPPGYGGPSQSIRMERGTGGRIVLTNRPRGGAGK
jgi:soluble lytic murein transglycosylase-like protein